MSGAKNKQPHKVLLWVISGAFAFLVIPFANNSKARAADGISVEPANIILDLPKDQFQAEATVRLTNGYSQPITLKLSVEVPQNSTATDRKALNAIKVDSSSLTLAAGETISKTLTIQDSEQLPPGSARAELVISQPVSPVDVGIAPQLRLPISLVKQDGATTAISLSEIKLPVFALRLPKTVDVVIKNTGNTLAIPRGTLTVNGPNGKILGKGTLNTGSIAVAAGQNLTVGTSLAKVNVGRWPGIYTASVSYSLGGDNPRKTAAVSFVYVAWWQVLILAALCAVAFLTAKKIFKPKKFVSNKYSSKRKANIIKRLVP